LPTRGRRITVGKAYGVRKDKSRWNDGGEGLYSCDTRGLQKAKVLEKKEGVAEK